MVKYQLVLQWPSDSIEDYDAMVAIEDELIDGLGDEHVVDGHDVGCGEINIFIHTDNARGAFKRAMALFNGRDFWSRMLAAFREMEGEEYTVLWPEGLSRFEVA